MNVKLILLSIVTLLYFLGAQWLYSNKVAGVCCGPEKIIVKEGAPKENLGFAWNDPNPIPGTNFEEFKKEEILKQMTANNILQITGLYVPTETAPEGFDNMGVARADALRNLLKDDIPISRIDISSRNVSRLDTTGGTPFSAVTFSWKNPLAKEETTIIATENEATIYFPFNSSVRDANPQVDQYLAQVAERLKQSEEKVQITGHTDNIGEEAQNFQLGLQRAESIRDNLVKAGIPADRISIESKGEKQPATSNDTEDGRHRNRRTVLRILQ